MTSFGVLFAALLCARFGCSWTRTVVDTDSSESLVTGVVGGIRRNELLSDDSVESVNNVSVNSGNFNGGLVERSVSTNVEDNLKRYTDDLQEWFRDEGEGRHFKRKKMMMRMVMWLKTLGLGVVLPSAVALALFAAWKGVTISLLALLLAGVVGLKGLIASASKNSSGSVPQHVVLSGVPTHHQHYWKRSDAVGDSTAWSDSSHQLAYSAYT